MTVTWDSSRIHWNPKNAFEFCVKLGMFRQRDKLHSLKSKLEKMNCAVTLRN
jgi:hypothetical protein